MKDQEPISSIMTRDIYTVDIDQSLHDVHHLFAKHHIRHLPVLADKELVGIISQTDILRISFGHAFGDEQEDADEAIFDMLSVNQIMKHDPVIISQDQTIREAATIFTNHEFHALPVMDNRELVGIITTTDILRYYLAQ